MKLHRTALGAALLASAVAGSAYAGNYGNTTDAAQAHRSNPVSAEQQQQVDRSSTTRTAPSGQSSTVPSGTAPSNAANERDLQALDRNHDGVISPDERKQLKPDTSGSSGMSGPTGTDASGTQPSQGPGSAADKARGTTATPRPAR